MRHIGMKAAFAALTAGGVLVLGGELGAVGAIDTGGATLQPGDAASPGAVTIAPDATLGVVPAAESLPDLFESSLEDDEEYWLFYDPFNPEYGEEDGKYTFPGLGGPDFHAHADLTMPVGTHDYGAFRVDPGVTVTIPVGSVIVIAGDARIDGRIEMASTTLHFGGDVTITGHPGPVKSGIYATSASVYSSVIVSGRLMADAEEGAEVEFGAPSPTSYWGGFSMKLWGRARSTVAHARIENMNFKLLSDLELTDVTAPRTYVEAASGVSASIRRGSYSDVSWYVGGDLTIADAVIPQCYPTVGGALHIQGSTTMEAFGAECYGDLVVEDTCSVRGAGLYVTSFRGKVELGSGVQTDIGTGEWGGLNVNAWKGATIAGSYRGNSHAIYAQRGDILFRDGTVLTADAGTGQHYTIDLLAQGAIATTDGSMDLKATEFNIRSVTGDLDIDVNSMTATTGKIVVLSNGAVRMRGAYRAAQEIQILSRKDSIDVSGATIRTDDAGAGLSGFVRLATYASTAAIDASDATIRTGDANGQSGDILLQVAKSGEETATGMLKVAATTTQRTSRGVVTRVKGTVTSPRRAVSFNGSNRVAAGPRAHHVFLRGRGSRVSGRADKAELVVTQNGSRRMNFDLTLRDGGGTPGTTVALALERAGFRANGKFRRPKSK